MKLDNNLHSDCGIDVAISRLLHCRKPT